MSIRRILVLPAIILLSVTPPLFAQGRGGRGRGSHQGQSSPQSMGHHGQQTGTQDRQRYRIHATGPQRDQYRICTQSVNRGRTQARNMVQFANGSGFIVEQARQQRDQLRNEIRTMQQEHDRFMQRLSDDERAAMQDRVRKMDQARDRVNLSIQAMNEGFKQVNPDQQHIAKQARKIEKAMKEWQKQYHKMGSDMEIESDS